MRSKRPELTHIKTAEQRPLYSNTVIGTLAVDGWAVTFGTARMGLGGLGYSYLFIYLLAYQ